MRSRRSSVGPVTEYECSSTTEPPVRCAPRLRFPFVAFEHADVVQRRSPARPEERRPGLTTPAGPATAAAPRTAAPCPVAATRARQSSSPSPAEPSTMCCRPATSVASTTPSQSKSAPESVRTRSRRLGLHRGDGYAGVEVRAARLQIPAQRVPQCDIEVGVGDVEDQSLARAEEVDVEHGGQLGRRQRAAARRRSCGRTPRTPDAVRPRES